MRLGQRRRVCASIERCLFTGAPMPLNFPTAAAVERTEQAETGAYAERREQLFTVVAASLAVLIVAAIAVLIGMA